jgi:hypothetical protein
MEKEFPLADRLRNGGHQQLATGTIARSSVLEGTDLREKAKNQVSLAQTDDFETNFVSTYLIKLLFYC